MTDSTPSDAPDPDAAPDDSGASAASDEEASAVVRTAIDALDAILGPAPTDDRDAEVDAPNEDAESDPH
jgi:hypothetical protein